jgi:hypothetical protein
VNAPVVPRERFPTPYKVIGSCSVCGPCGCAGHGRMGTLADKKAPRCDDCGATARTTYGPTIDMIPAGDMRRAWSDMNEEQRQCCFEHGSAQ